MNTRKHISSYYRTLHHDRHSRKLRVNSHRKEMADWRLSYRIHDDGRLTINLVRNGIDQFEHEVPKLYVAAIDDSCEKAFWCEKSKEFSGVIGVDYWISST